MTIHFTNEEQKYIHTNEKDNCKIEIKTNVPNEIKKGLEGKVKVFNDWIDEINGVEK